MFSELRIRVEPFLQDLGGQSDLTGATDPQRIGQRQKFVQGDRVRDGFCHTGEQRLDRLSAHLAVFRRPDDGARVLEGFRQRLGRPRRGNAAHDPSRLDGKDHSQAVDQEIE